MKNEEFRLCCAIADYVRARYPWLIRDKHFFAFPAGEKRSKTTGAKIKRTGGIAGVPDYLLTTRCGYYSMLWLEIKTESGRLSEEQKVFFRTHRQDGHICVVTFGYDEAIEVIESWLMGDVENVEWYARTDTKAARNKARAESNQE